MAFCTLRSVPCGYLVLGWVAVALNAQGNMLSLAKPQPPQHPLPVLAPIPLNRFSIDAAVPQKAIGPIGVDRHVNSFCTFFTNSTYSCKTDCRSDEGVPKGFPDQPLMKYTDLNCSTDVPIDGAKWKQDDGVVKRTFDASAPTQIIATCAFYRTNWFECHGIADCSRGEGITHCAGGAPWRGYYDGTPQKGFTGNVTAEAQNSSPMVPSLPIPQVASGPSRKLLYICEKFVDISQSSCYGLEKKCGTVGGRSACTATRVPVTRTSLNDKIFKAFDGVVSSIDQQSLSLASEIVASCYFFDNHDLQCGFPFAADFNGPFLTQSGGSYYSGIY